MMSERSKETTGQESAGGEDLDRVTALRQSSPEDGAAVGQGREKVDQPWEGYTSSAHTGWRVSESFKAQQTINKTLDQARTTAAVAGLNKLGASNEHPTSEHGYQAQFEQQLSKLLATSDVVSKAIAYFKSEQNVIDGINQRHQTVLGPSFTFEIPNPLAFKRNIEGHYELGQGLVKAATWTALLGSAAGMSYAAYLTNNLENRIGLVSLIACAPVFIGIPVIGSAKWLQSKISGLIERAWLGAKHPGLESNVLKDLSQQFAAKGMQCQINLGITPKGAWELTITPLISHKNMSLDETSQKKSASIGLREWNFLSNLGITADTWNSIASLGNSISRKISSTLAYFKAQRDERKALNLSESASQDTVRIEASARDLDIVNKVRKAEPGQTHTFKLAQLTDMPDIYPRVLLTGLGLSGLASGVALAWPAIINHLALGTPLLSSAISAGTGLLIGFTLGAVLPAIAMECVSRVTFNLFPGLADVWREKAENLSLWLTKSRSSPTLRQVAKELKKFDEGADIKLSTDEEGHLILTVTTSEKR